MHNKHLTTQHFLLCLLGLLLSSISHAQINYSFGVVPQQSASKTATQWIPILNYLGKATGFNFHFKTTKNIPTFEDYLQQASYDLAYMNPYHYIVYHDSADYHAIARAKDTYIRGIIVVHQNSSFNNLQSLANRHIAFPSPNAFAASMLIQAELNKQDIEFTPAYVSSHDSVYRNVYQKRTDAGGGVERTFLNMDKKITNQLRILYKTASYTPHAIAASNRIPLSHRKKIITALTEMNNTPEGQKLLKQIKLGAFTEAVDSDWNDVRKLYPEYE